MDNNKDLIGQKFNMLTVVKRVENYISPKGKKRTQWECLCDCGNITIATTSELITNHKKSCGCIRGKHRVIDLTNKRFGRLTVIERAENMGDRVAWRCLCDCGNTIVTTSNRLIIGDTQSCGCYNKDRIIERNKRYNRFDIRDDYVIGYTKEGNLFYVDLDDFDRVKQYYWAENIHGYIIGWINGKKVFLHRFIMGCYDNDVVIDHIGGTSSIKDNRKYNLRIVTQSQNMMNTKLYNNNSSGHKGIVFDKKSGKWIAQIQCNNELHWLGGFDDINDAIKARKAGEEKYFGEYSHDNSQLYFNSFKKEI